MTVCLIASSYLKSYWKPYNDPSSFFKIMMFNAAESDQKDFVEKPTLTLPISVVRRLFESVFNWDFLEQLSWLAIFPYPISDNTVFYMQAHDILNGTYVEVGYYWSDILLTFIFLRVFFIIKWLAI